MFLAAPTKRLRPGQRHSEPAFLSRLLGPPLRANAPHCSGEYLCILQEIPWNDILETPFFFWGWDVAGSRSMSWSACRALETDSLLTTSSQLDSGKSLRPSFFPQLDTKLLIALSTSWGCCKSGERGWPGVWP